VDSELNLENSQLQLHVSIQIIYLFFFFFFKFETINKQKFSSSPSSIQSNIKKKKYLDYL
jgi:hypothetical protein